MMNDELEAAGDAAMATKGDAAPWSAGWKANQASLQTLINAEKILTYHTYITYYVQYGTYLSLASIFKLF